MTLIAAALEEELRIGLDLCKSKTCLKLVGVRAWRATRGGQAITFLKTGVGPIRAEKSLNLFLRNERPSRILVVGYSGALDPGLKLGDLVAPEQASLLSEALSPEAVPEGFQLSGTWPLAESKALYEESKAAGLTLHRGHVLTSHHIIGNPSQKLRLHQKFHVSIVDMETAALARAAAQAGLSLSCIRAVSDEARDEFLAPFSYDPSASAALRALKALAAGNWIGRYRQWKEHAAEARRSLRRFLVWYLDAYSI